MCAVKKLYIDFAICSLIPGTAINSSTEAIFLYFVIVQNGQIKPFPFA